jgi:hypothetical protein
MKPQKPANGIMLTNEWMDAKTFHIECDCTDPDHAVDMWVEVEGDHILPNTVTVSFYVKTTNEVWREGYSRLRAVWEILTKGVHTQSNTLLLNKQAALNFAEAIKTTVKELDTKS